MASKQTIEHITTLLFSAPLANSPTLEDRPGVVKVMALTLRDIDDELLKTAVIQHIATQKWFPSVADLRGAAQALIQRADGLPDSYTAWKEVKANLGRSNPQWSHPLVEKAINALGGLRDFGLSDVNDESSWRARFIAAYEQYQKREAEDRMMLPVVGSYVDKLAAGRERVNTAVNGLAAGMRMVQ